LARERKAGDGLTGRKFTSGEAIGGKTGIGVLLAVGRIG
jgi:hypothetical protein